MIDDAILWIDPNTHLSFSAMRWQMWCEKFVEVVTKHNCLVITARGYRIVDIGGESSYSTWWGAERIMWSVVGDRQGLMEDVERQLGVARSRHLDQAQIIPNLYAMLCKDHTVVKALKLYARATTITKEALIAQHQEQVQAAIRLHFDETANLSVQFVVPPNTTYQLYYVAGVELHFIADVRLYAQKNNDVKLGNFIQEVHVDVAEAELYDPFHGQR